MYFKETNHAQSGSVQIVEGYLTLNFKDLSVGETKTIIFSGDGWAKCNAQKDKLDDKIGYRLAAMRAENKALTSTYKWLLKAKASIVEELNRLEKCLDKVGERSEALEEKIAKLSGEGA